MKEIVTIQVGGFANFIGSHFWNFQDELLGLAADPYGDPVFKNHSLNMDVLYRSGETQQGTLTYSPRLVSVDFQGSLGSMSSRGSFYNEATSAPPDVVTWTGNVSTHVAEPRRRNLFLQRLNEEEQENSTPVNNISGGRNDPQREIHDEDIVDYLDNGVEYWTDFSKVHYHPQSLYELGGLWMDSQQFDSYGVGRDAFSWDLRGEEISERLRFFVEECDHVQKNGTFFLGVLYDFPRSVFVQPTVLRVLFAYEVNLDPRTQSQARFSKMEHCDCRLSTRVGSHYKRV